MSGRGSRTRRPRAQGTAPAPIPRWLGRVFEPLYSLELARRNKRHDRGKGVRHIDRPVISVGNLSVGGTGKTPTVKAVLAMLLELGHRPCVAMRGYKATAAIESDEAGELRRAFESVPVVANPDRWSGLQQLFATPFGQRVDVVVLDDGFQHRRLARDLDIVLIDATRDVFADRLLPAGWLREPVRSVRRADVVVLTHAKEVAPDVIERLRGRVAALAPGLVVATSAHRWSSLVVVDEPSQVAPGSEAEAPPAESHVARSWLSGRRCVAVCAIGNPESFLLEVRRTVGGETRSGGAVAACMVLPDHDPYAPQTVDRLIETARELNAEAIVTTEKDWTKLRKVDPHRWPCPVVRPVLEVVFDAGGEELRRRVARAAAG